MSGPEVLAELAEAAAGAALAALNALAGESAERRAVAVPSDGIDPLADLVLPAAVAVAAFSGGEGGSMLFAGADAAERLATFAGGPDKASGAVGGLGEAALAAYAKAAGRVLTAAAAAAEGSLELSAPAAQVLESPEDAGTLVAATPYPLVIDLTLFGEPCRLVMFLPAEVAAAAMSAAPAETATSSFAVAGGLDEEMLRGVSLRLWAELGRARLPVGRAVGLASGSVVELDRSVDDPVDLFVNGRRFATGSLLVSDDGDWAVRIDAITAAGVEPPEAAELI